MSNNTEIVHQFYQCFASKDVEGMVSLYHDQVQFTDPAFGTLQGERAKMMWRMLIERGSDNLSITHHNVQKINDTVQAQWHADYLYGAKKRKVHNEVQAQFRFKDGKIIEHVDDFNLHRWAKQALGFSGLLLGGTNFFKNKIQKTTNTFLDKYIEKVRS